MRMRSLPFVSVTLACVTIGLSVVGCGEKTPDGAGEAEATGGVSNGSGGADSSSTTKSTGKGGSSAKTSAAGKGGQKATSAANEQGGAENEGGNAATSSEPENEGGTSSSAGGTSSRRTGRTTKAGGGTSGSAASGGTNATSSSQGVGGTKASSSSALSTNPSSQKFSFFAVSYAAIIKLSGSDKGFGGDLRFGETGDGAGLRGADKICTQVAETSMPNNGKTWRAFLSTSKENAIDRIGDGPWYDRRERLFAQTKADLLATRPKGADSAIINDFPNENGVLNHDPDGTGNVDNHDFLTGSGIDGKRYTKTADPTCADWTSSAADNSKDKRPRVGHSWPRSGFGGGAWPGSGTGSGGSGSGAGNVEGMEHWISALDESGCGPGVYIPGAGEFDGPPGSDGTVGSGGGYGGWYCFALTP